MANLNETPTWEPGVYQLEEEDLVQGGPDGIDNAQAKQLGNRTQYLKQQIEAAIGEMADHLVAADPHTQYATEVWVAQQINALIDAAPGAMDTLNELAAALGDDANFAATMTTALNNRLQIAAYQKAENVVATAAGTADAITAAFTPAIAALTHGMTLHVRAAAANATTTPTFTPAAGTIAAKAIVKGNNLPLAVGDIAGAGHWLTFCYDQTLDKWVLKTPAKGVIAGVLITDFTGSNQSLAANGWQKLPGSLILQWVTGTQVSLGTAAVTSQTITLPMTFPNAILGIATGFKWGSGTAIDVSTKNESNSQIDLYSRNNSSSSSVVATPTAVLIGY